MKLLIASLLVLLGFSSAHAQRDFQPKIAITNSLSTGGGGGGASSNLVTTSPVALTERSDSNLRLGFTFTPTVDLDVVEVGRWVVSGNSQTHPCGVSVFATGDIVVSNNLNTVGLPVGYNTVAVTPAILSAGTKYVAWSKEFSGGDVWYENEGYTLTSDATINFSAYESGGTFAENSPNAAYVPVQIKVRRR
jgi:hypothetical protein